MADHPPDGGTTRLERDSFGDIRVPAARLWGGADPAFPAAFRYFDRMPAR